MPSGDSTLWVLRMPFWRTLILAFGLSVVLLSRRARRKIVLGYYLPFVLLSEVGKLGLRFRSVLQPDGLSVATSGVDESTFPDENEFQSIVDRIGNAGARTTGSRAHNDFISWIESELRSIPGLSIRTDEYNIPRWQTVNGRSLKDAGKLTIGTSGEKHDVPIAGAVPFALPTACQSGQMIYVPRNVRIREAAITGKVITRDFPVKPIPYSLGLIPSYSKTVDLNADLLSDFDRPGLADGPLNQELLDAGNAGAAGMIIMFDILREQVESYFEPHRGMHYQMPAVFVGVDEAAILKARAAEGATASISIEAEVSTVPTRNVLATLPGQIEERIIYLSHTDGNTFVQENGPAALLTLARYYAKQPLSSRRRTIEFAFNTGHLHISREGSVRHAMQLDETFEDGTIALVIAVEHLGTREIEAVARAGGELSRELRFLRRGEVTSWCIGPSPAVVRAVRDAVSRRKLDRVVLHAAEAVDVSRLRKQTLAIGDIYLAVENLPRDTIAAGYVDYRKRRDNGAKAWRNFEDAVAF